MTNDYREALKVSEAILDTSCDMNYKWMAMYVKAESLFNMCDFEHAMVFYLRAKRLAPTSVSEMISGLMLWSYFRLFKQQYLDLFQKYGIIV